MEERGNRLENKLNIMSQEVNIIKENLGAINLDMKKKDEKLDLIINSSKIKPDIYIPTIFQKNN